MTWNTKRVENSLILHSFLLWHLRAFFSTVKAYSQRQNNLKKSQVWIFSKKKKWPNWQGKHISLKMEMSKVWLHNKKCLKSFLKNFGTFSSGPKNVHIHCTVLCLLSEFFQNLKRHYFCKNLALYVCILNRNSFFYLPGQ